MMLIWKLSERQATRSFGSTSNGNYFRSPDPFTNFGKRGCDASNLRYCIASCRCLSNTHRQQRMPLRRRTAPCKVGLRGLQGNTRNEDRVPRPIKRIGSFLLAAEVLNSDVSGVHVFHRKSYPDLSPGTCVFSNAVFSEIPIFSKDSNIICFI